MAPRTPKTTAQAGSNDAATPVSKAGKYTWQDVAKHCTDGDVWVYVGNKVYDISSWLERHPGGKEMLLLAAGRDVTDMFKSYHPFSDKADQVLAKFEIGTLVEPERPQFKPDTGFYKTVSKRVGEYFEKTGKNPKSAFHGLIYLSFMFAVALTAFNVMYNHAYPLPVRILSAIVFGVFQALPLLHSMHDASHTAIGNQPWYWKIIGPLCMDYFAGASVASWHNQHIVGHHLYTNVVGVDPDLPMTQSGDIRRVTTAQSWMSAYKFQHIYLMFLYGFLGLKFRFQDIIGLITGQNGPIRVHVTAWSWISQIISKTFWFCWRVALPLFVWKISSSEYWSMFLLADMVTGWYLAFNFQVSHVSPSTDFPDLLTASSLDDEWAVSQVKTTVDYGHGNAVLTWLAGALNYQTIHHLFPGVSQYHYPAIAPIVRKTCEEYKIRYNHLPTFWVAFKAHVAHLREMGDKHSTHHYH